MPALERGERGKALALDSRRDRFVHRPRPLLGVRVEKYAGPVATDDHAVAELLALFGLELERRQPLGELRSIALVVEVDRYAPVVAHPAESLAGRYQTLR